MKKQYTQRVKRGFSFGTVVMLLFTACVLLGFLLLLPTFTGNQDIRVDAAKLAVAMDTSFAQLAASANVQRLQAPQSTVLPPENLATAVPLRPAATPLPTPVPKLQFSLCAAGSILWNTTVEKAFTYDGETHFDIMTDQLRGALTADLSIATLENTLIASQKKSNINLPPQMLSHIRQTGINVLNLGHHNTLNGGISGFSETAEAVSEAGIMPFGVRASAQDGLVIRDCGGVQVALLHYQDEISSTGRKQTTAEEREAAISPIQLPRIAEEIALVRNAGAQVVVVSLCWGKTGATQPTETQISLAQAIADAGADIILGTHSGVLQPVRVLSANRGDGKYHPVLCAYSLGYFFSPDRESRTTISSILLKANVTYDAATKTVAFEELGYTPIYAWRGKDNGRTLYRVLTNDGKNYPAFVDENQKSVMERCRKLVTDVMADTGISETK